MTKQGNDDKELEDAISLGRKNKELIPSVKNWCSNVQIDDVSGGMIAGMYNLPITLQISCPHAGGSSQAMNFEWIARDFIIDNCQSCEFHSEVHNKNFGKVVINEHEELEKEESQKRKQLKDQVESLVAKEKSKAEVTELSILNLIQSFEDDATRINTSKQILEASKLSPTFFGDIALDYLSLQIEDKDVGGEVLQTIENVLRTGKTLSSFCFERLKVAIENGIHIDGCIGVLNLVIVENDFIKYETLINQIIDSLWYKHSIGDPYDNRRSYPNSVSLLVRVHQHTPDLLFTLLDNKLKINDKTTRINTNYLLQELLIANSDCVKPHCAAIIESLELEDDKYEESADTITCMTLSELYKSDQKLVKSIVDSLFLTLSDGAKVEFISFFEIILLNEKFISESRLDAENIIETLLKLVFAPETTKELKAEVLSVLEDISKKRPALLSTSFDSLIGFLIGQIKAYKTFLWYLSELEDSKKTISTFNPLQGKNYWDIESEKIEIIQSVNRAESIVEYLISNDTPNNGYKKAIEIILNLESSSDGLLKSKLIAIIRKSINEPLRLAEQLPSIYNFLLDTESKEVRYEAINFVSHLIEKHDQLVTRTLIDMIKVFMNDVDRGVKAKAIQAFGSVIKKFPEEVEQEQIQTVLKSVVDSYVGVHKKAAKLAYKIFPFLNEDQKLVLIYGISALEKSYNDEKDFSYCKELVDILLFLTKENPKMYSMIVHNYVTKYCNSNDYYTDANSIEKLSYIRSQNEEFNQVWLSQSLGFLFKTKPDYYNPHFDSRRDLFATMYKIPKQIIVNQLDEIKKLIAQKTKSGDFNDVFELFGVLSYFCLYDVVQELSNYFEKTVKKNKSNKHAISTNELCGKIADLELRVNNKQVDKSFINSLANR